MRQVLKRATIKPIHLVFGGLMFIWAVVFLYFAGVSFIQISSAFLLALTYFLWGVVYHLKHNTLHLRNVLEYLIMAFIGFVILSFIIT